MSDIKVTIQVDKSQNMSPAMNQPLIDSMNVPQGRAENRAFLDSMRGTSGLVGVDLLVQMLAVNVATGLTAEQVVAHRAKFGTNAMPASPKTSYLTLLFRALTDTTLLVLIAAACVSFGIGYWEDPKIGWIEGTAIFIAVFLVSNISAGNDYSKELQFRALEASSQHDQRASVFRDGQVDLINPSEMVVGDICILQTGDMITADCVVVDNNEISSNESGLTGEPKDVRKSKAGDCFLLSSCLLTEGEGCRAVVIGIGMSSQWGKIKANLVTENVNTPLQEKLEKMTTLIGYIGIVAAIATFAALVVRIFTDHGLSPSKKELSKGFIGAFILAVTIVVVAIPEGLPLAVTISLAYSTKKMYNDKCSIRQLAACETMGNATTICSDKTGTLTENRMTVVEGWFGNKEVGTAEILLMSEGWISHPLKLSIVENASINRTAYLVMTNEKGEKLDSPLIIGNKTEGALINLIRSWGEDYERVKNAFYKEGTDKIFPFDSTKKRSTVVLFRADGTVRLYCKGATEVLLSDCSHYTDVAGDTQAMTPAMLRSLDMKINFMAKKALRTLMLAHVDFASPKDLPLDWEKSPPDDKNLVCDCIVGIQDPLRKDVKEAVLTAQRAGVVVRMVTGDNIHTASAIATDCGILTKGGVALEGPVFRNMTPKDLDAVLPRLQVLARSSPEDKFLLVCRLNGYALPKTQAEWEEKHKKRIALGATWENDRDKILPGHYAEWIASRPGGGQVVGVTGDGTNDAPALKAADVGMAMGISGTKVAQEAADVVILDDKFGSIVKAIMWGRTVYDNIRKFLQFQLTVNVVALLLVFIGAVAGFGQPLNAVMMLWVNLVMDTMGALALGTEAPSNTCLLRKPYKRAASLISRPMWRNILSQSAFQLILLFILLFQGAELFGVRPLGGENCFTFYVDENSERWDATTLSKSSTGTLTCGSFKTYCPDLTDGCFNTVHTEGATTFKYSDLEEFQLSCLTCNKRDYTHGTIIFNAFIFCQFFNEYTARKILNEWNAFDDLLGNYTFLLVSFFTLGLQIFLVEVGGDFVRTSSLSLVQWLVTIALGAIGIPVGILMRFIPIVEDPNTFFSADAITCSGQELEELDSDGELSPELKSKYMELRSDEQKTGTTDADV